MCVAIVTKKDAMFILCSSLEERALEERERVYFAGGVKRVNLNQGEEGREMNLNSKPRRGSEIEQKVVRV